MDPMWGRSGPVAGGHGSVDTENGALAYGANVFYINTSIFCIGKTIKLLKIVIFHLKYVQMCPGHKFFQNVNISFEICVNVFQLIQNVNISFEICANVSGSCADPFKMLIFHLKYV